MTGSPEASVWYYQYWPSNITDIMLGQVEGHGSRENHGCDGLTASNVMGSGVQ
jgi:hypothetical protein